MPLPVVAIVGRPNVGKSSLFNALAGRRASIVEPTAGVTRDRVTEVCEIGASYVELVDTGGIGVVDRDDLGEHVERQIRYAVNQAVVILFVVDAREGLTPLDRAAGRFLSACHDRTVLIANKVDHPHMEIGGVEFIKLGFGEPMIVSAQTGYGRWEIVDRIREMLEPLARAEPTKPEMKVAIVGKRNSGKSTFINALAGEERVIVSEVPGTTRDSIDVRFEYGGHSFLAIDTAGVKKKSRLADSIEFYSAVRARESIQRADVVLLLIDAAEPVGQVDKRLAHEIVGTYKPCILVVNKWDLAESSSDTDAYHDYLTRVLPGIDYAPISFTTARTAENVFQTIDLASALFRQARRRVSTGRLNQIVTAAIGIQSPKPKRGNKTPKVLYATQAALQPPTIVLFVNNPALVTPAYERFLAKRLRQALPYREIPLRLLFRARRRKAISD
jgi:GTP-binding protein